MRKFFALVFFFVLLMVTPYYVINQKFEGNTITLGMSGPFSGGLNSVGNQFLMGANIYFENLNKTGGVYGREIKIIAKDDRYEPRIAIEFLRNPINPLVLNARAGDMDEIEKLVKYYVDVLHFKKIALFYQNDAYGNAGLIGVKSALERRNLTLAGEGSYKRNTLSVGNALYEIELCNPDVILMIGSTAPVAEFIKRARKSSKIDKNVHFGLFSFVEPYQLIELVNKEGKNITFAQVVPSPWTSEVDEVEQYRVLMRKYYPQERLSHVSLEGFFAARMIAEVFKTVGPSFTKEEFIKELGHFSQTLDENAVSKNRDERCKCLHRVHLSEYVEDDFFSIGERDE